MQTDTFLHDDRIIRTADAIANLQPCPFAGHVTRDQVLTAMGLIGDIWPESIRDDVIRVMVEHSEKQCGPGDEDEADFLEDGDTPTPDPDFISEEEDENPSGVVA